MVTVFKKNEKKNCLDYRSGRKKIILKKIKLTKKLIKKNYRLDYWSGHGRTNRTVCYGPVQDLYRLVEHCEYGELREQLIRDRIVVGVSDCALSDRLQAQADLTLDQSVQISRQSESRKQQRGVVRDGRDVNTTIEFVKRDQRPSTKPNTARRSGTCKWCGSQQEHDRPSVICVPNLVTSVQSAAAVLATKMV